MAEADVYHAIDRALSHYDHKCRSAGRAGPNGFLNGFKNTIQKDGKAEHMLTLSELDLLNKILEGQDVEQGLAATARDCLIDLMAEHQRVDRIMEAVHHPNKLPSRPDNAESEYAYETLALTEGDIRDAVRIARGKNFDSLAQIAQGVLAIYLDRIQDGSAKCDLTEKELRALAIVLDGHHVREHAMNALRRFAARTETP
jgi:hypothetical protein